MVLTLLQTNIQTNKKRLKSFLNKQVKGPNSMTCGIFIKCVHFDKLPVKLPQKSLFSASYFSFETHFFLSLYWHQH